MTTESRRSVVQVAAWLALAVGTMSILNGTHSTGEAVEQFALSISSGAFFFGGLGLVIAAVATIAVLFLMSTHHH